MENFAAGVSTRSWECSIDSVNGPRFVSVGTEIDLSTAMSGRTTLFAEGMSVMDGKLIFPPGAQIILGVISPIPVPTISPTTLSPTTLPPGGAVVGAGATPPPTSPPVPRPITRRRRREVPLYRSFYQPRRTAPP